MAETKIQKITSRRVDEEYYKIDHKSGLAIYVYPKAGYTSSYGIFGTKFGSINNAFSIAKDDNASAVLSEVERVPDGIAHFLEHKLFESEEQDAFERFAKTGANANAYTSFDKTCYLFSTSEKLKENLQILLDFVQAPYFTEKTVQKEQGIIGQEIKMYDDSPEWRVMFNMLEAMYHNHPVKIDIAGTVESISKITAQGLYDCYNTFYNLHNMVLCVCGGTTPEEVLNIADDMLKAAPKAKVQSYFEDEPYEVKTTYVEQAFPVTMELFNLGFKEKAGAEQISNKLLAQTEVLLAAIASSTADLYRELMDEGLINQSFSYELFEGPGFLSVIFGGESRNPKGAAKKIKEYIAKVKQTGISKADFEISKKALYGDAISALNSVDTIGNMLVDSHFTSREFFGYVDEIAAVTFEEANNRLKEILDVNNTSLSIITKQ